jgi:4-alpha-glucanotransferase
VSKVDRPRLRALAKAAGILPAYRDQGGLLRLATDRTRIALLAAMGLDASTEAAAHRALESLRAAAEDPGSASAQVITQDEARAVTLPAGHRGPFVEWEAEVVEEGGARHHTGGRAGRAGNRTVVARVVGGLPPGYHTLGYRIRGADGDQFEGSQSLIVTPTSCCTPRTKLGRRRAYGLLAQLYAVRGQQDWGIGDLGSLRRLLSWGGKNGAAFVGLNPLHALANRGDEISPYSPLSRLYGNVIYLDVRAIPELALVPALRRRLGSRAFQQKLAALRASRHVRYEHVMAVKEPVLRTLHRAFATHHRDRQTARGRAYRRYLAREGGSLTLFATFLALRDRLGRRYGRDWHRWPRAYRVHDSAAVRAFAAANPEEIDFHRYVQFELDRQLGRAAAAARRAGMAVGLYQDLAIGSSAIGSDAWAFSDLFLQGVTIGAPPDLWYARGQNWGFHPIDPRRLRATGYGYWIHLVRAALAHAGALRIDHVMGLFRQFWIPAGRPASEGAYIRFPATELLGILALESRRANALVIGEDLGTVPRGLPRQLARWGILSTRVLFFCRDRRGTFVPADAYPARALVSANTHDMVPLAGYLRGRDIDLRRRTQQFPSAAAVARAYTERAVERRALVRRLAGTGLLPDTAAPPDDATLRGAVHAFLCRTPAALVGISLEDLAGQAEPVNLPGVGRDTFPSWSRRLPLSLEQFASDRGVATAMDGVRRSARAALGARRSFRRSRARARRSK